MRLARDRRWGVTIVEAHAPSGVVEHSVQSSGTTSGAWRFGGSSIAARRTHVGLHGGFAAMNGPTVRVIPAADLSEFECERWAELQDADHALASPFFSPDFVRCASSASPNVFVAILEIGDRQVGFFSFERSGRSGHPVGRRFA